MRILFLTHRLPYAPNRGDRIRAHHILRVLGRTHDVDLISLIHARDEWEHLNDLNGVVASATGVRVARMRNALSAALALPGSRPLTHVLLHASRMDAVLRQRVNETPPDVVVAYCTGMARYAVEAPLRRFPFVLDMVDVDSEKWARLADTVAPPFSWVYRREAASLGKFERKAAERASATIVVSERERALLERTQPSIRAVVVENGVEVASFAPHDVTPRQLRVVFCGVFNYAPNEAGAVWMALRVWPLVRQLLPEARLTLVGMNPSRAVRALAEDPSITVTGAVPDVRPYLWTSAVSVAPILLARGVQNKVLEAVAAGLPCVVTPPVFEGLPVPIRPACIVAADPTAFANATVSLLKENADQRRRFVERANLSQLGWDTQLLPFLSVVEAVRDRAARSRN